MNKKAVLLKHDLMYCRIMESRFQKYMARKNTILLETHDIFFDKIFQMTRTSANWKLMTVALMPNVKIRLVLFIVNVTRDIQGMAG